MQLTLPLIGRLCSTLITNAKASNPTFVPSYDSTVGALDKIAKTVRIPQVYGDRLPELNGDFLPLGKTIEEYFVNLVEPGDFDSTGAGALTPSSDPSYMPCQYSYTIGRKKIKITRKYDDLERAFSSEQAYQAALADITKSLADSQAVYNYSLKRNLLGVLATQAEAEMTAAAVFAVSTAYTVSTVLKESSSSDVRGIVVKAIPSSSAKTWAQNIEDGFIIVLNLVSALAVPTDTASGEAFIKQVKADVEVAGDVSEGYSLNGNTLGEQGELTLYVKQGVFPSLDVDTMAGAFQLDKLSIPAKVKVIKDFGANTNVYAMLVDTRGIKLYPTYLAVRDNRNGDGDFINYFEHSEFTAHYSRYTFVKCYKNV